jgi:hypothetical protein
MIEGICVPPDQVKEAWPRIAYLVSQALECGDTPLSEVESDVMAGRGLLWLVVEDRQVLAAVTTHLETVKGIKVCTISSCAGGPIEKIMPFIGRLEQYGRDEKCQRMRVNGRRGWGKLLKDYELTQTVLEKAL